MRDYSTFKIPHSTLFFFSAFFDHARHVVGQIHREEGEDYHAAHGQYDGYNLARWRNRRYVTAYGGHIHCRPPQCRPIGVHLGV